MERLTEHSKQTSHENGICCTHFRGPECLEVGGNCAMNCKWEEAAWSRLAAYEDTRLEPEEIDMDHEAAEQLRRLCRNCDIDRLEELAEADKNGRVVVLPRWKNEEERLERRRLMRIMADGAIDRLMENPLKEENGPDIAELRVVNTDRLLELAKADEDGRLVVLPCKVGDTVWVTGRDNVPREMELEAPDIRAVCTDEDNLCMSTCNRKPDGFCAYRLRNDGADIGKTVFLTREEAEKALEAMKQ